MTKLPPMISVGKSIRVGKKHALTDPSQSKHTKKYLNNS